MTVAVIGSRGWPNRAVVRRFVDRLPEGTVVVSGGARGPDSWAVERAKERGLQTVVHPADWKKHGKSAGMKRNKSIAEDCDFLAAFWDEVSQGTAHTVTLVQRMDKPYVVFTREVVK